LSLIGATERLGFERMNKTSFDKIKLATPFLIWFRRCLPPPLQRQVRPYLDRPYQLALGILDRAGGSEPLPVKEIARLANVAPQTARQVLLALQEGGMTFAVSPTRGWQSSEAEALLSNSNLVPHDAEETVGSSVDSRQLDEILPISSSYPQRVASQHTRTQSA
jgi:hypothetical protein